MSQHVGVPDPSAALHENTDATAMAAPERCSTDAVIDLSSGATSYTVAKAEVTCFAEGSTFSVSSLQAVTIGRAPKIGVSS